MGEITTFLESSTIHGLVYISTTRRFIRLFWISVVIAGFIGSGVMIHNSVKDWEESPVKTTIETLPIKDIFLPKVTVCPPKNTFTNLNYDLMRMENLTLDNATRDELTKYAVQLLQEHVYDEVIRNLSLIEENNRYYNWYRGYTQFQLPYWAQSSTCSSTSMCSDFRLYYYIDTKATSGSFSTKFFGEKFNSSKVEQDLIYMLHIFPPTKD